MKPENRNYLWGILVGAILMFVPWWVALLVVAAVITYLVMSHDDGPSQA